MKFAEFFAGIGLVRLGLEQRGWICVFANDIDPRKAEIYRRNFGEDDLTVQDIAELEACQLPEFDVATASFPCQDLSLAGKRGGLTGKRSSTFNDFIRLLNDLRRYKRQPRGVIIENVMGLLTSHEGRDIRTVLSSLTSLGYTVDLLVIDAARFVPQSRVRVFVIGLQEAKVTQPDSISVEAALSHELRGAKVCRVFLENQDVRWGFLDLPTLPSQTVKSLEDVVEQDINGFTGERLAKELSYIRGSSRLRLAKALSTAQVTGSPVYLAGFRRMRGDLVSLELRDDGMAGCLRAITGGSSKQLLIQAKPDGSVVVRYMTAREYARLQGVPDDFWIPENQVAGLHAFGDAVAVPVLEWLGGTVADAFADELVPA